MNDEDKLQEILEELNNALGAIAEYGGAVRATSQMEETRDAMLKLEDAIHEQLG